MIRSALPIVLSLVAGIPAPLGAQALRLDLTTANRHLWRGVNRTTDWVAQVQVAGLLPLGRGALAAGVFETRELGRSGGGNITEVGRGQKGLGERDWWLEYRRPVGAIEIFGIWGRRSGSGDTLLAVDDDPAVELHRLKGASRNAPWELRWAPALPGFYTIRVRGDEGRATARCQ